jgi:hypothetical protein
LTAPAPATPYFDSAALSSLRELTAALPAFAALGSNLLQYAVVIDANFAISDLLHKHRNPDRPRTAAEEALASSVLRIHAPRWLDEEMTGSAIPQVARAHGIPERELQELWITYRAPLIWDESLKTSDAFAHSSNPKDMPYVALQCAVAAAGILTNDKGIERLGGKPLRLDFVLAIRDYARATAFCVGVRFGGTMIGWISVTALVEGIRGLAALVTKVPPWAKALCVVGVLVVVLYPKLRARVLDLLGEAWSAAELAAPELQRLIVTMQDKQQEAEAARQKSALLLGSGKI